LADQEKKKRYVSGWRYSANIRRINGLRARAREIFLPARTAGFPDWTPQTEGANGGVKYAMSRIKMAQPTFAKPKGRTWPHITQLPVKSLI
jgi:hypothetical protein